MANSGVRLALAGSALCAAAALAGLLAMSGTLRGAALSPLTAEVHLSDFPLPSGFGLEPDVVAEFLTEKLTIRAESDLALQLALGEDGQQQVIDIVIPRLVSAGVVRDMIAQVKPLANVLSVGGFKVAARVVVNNLGTDRADVVLTLPGAMLVEAASGSAEIRATSTGLTALNLGTMAAGESRTLRVWLGPEARIPRAALAQSVLLGDGAGTVGKVWIYDAQPTWAGADLQAMPAARWLVAGVLLAVFLAAALTFGLTLYAGMTPQRKRRRISAA